MFSISLMKVCNMKTLSFGHLSKLSLLAVVLRLGAVNAITPWVTGDVFVGVGDGKYQVYNNLGLFKETIGSGVPGFTTGCAFNDDANATKLYTTSFTAGKVVVFNETTPHDVLDEIVSPTSPESIVFDVNGNFYVGHADGDADIDKFDSDGNLLTSFDVIIESGGRGSDWIDLANDQVTIYYTSEGRKIKTFDVSGGGQGPDFATLPGTSGTAFALRLLPPGDSSGGLLVADKDRIVRLDSTGAVAQAYDVDQGLGSTYESRWFALNLDPDGQSFWAGDSNSKNFYKFNITSGVATVGPINVNTAPQGPRGDLFGMCVLGEPRTGPIVHGDPHFKTWRGTRYDYHGECDLLLLKSKTFASGLGLDVHIRTQIRRDMSYISSAALRIGSDVLEVQSQGVYYLNGVANAELPSEFSGFEFFHTQPKDKQHVFEVYLGGQERLKMMTYKDFVSVLIEQGKKANFGDSVGLMGDFRFGAKLGRDGKSVINDPNAFGQEWQVLDTDPMLFQSARFPQHPQKCTMPSPEATSALRRRLSEGSSADKLAAEKACAHWGAGKDECVFDVLVTGDLEMAMVGAY
jgi:hypothetical protein